MSHSSVGSDEEISGSKIPPLDSPTKRHVPHADSHGVIGTDEDIEHAHIEPFSHEEHHKHSAPRALHGSKADRLNPAAKGFKMMDPSSSQMKMGLDDAAVGTARLKPMGGTKEDPL